MKKIGIIMGSDSDLPVVEKAVNTLKDLEVPYEVHVYSAHRTPEEASPSSESCSGAIFCSSCSSGSCVFCSSASAAHSDHQYDLAAGRIRAGSLRAAGISSRSSIERALHHGKNDRH